MYVIRYIYQQNHVIKAYYIVGNWGSEKYTSLKMEHVDDLQFFSFYTVARATDNFSVAKKIREGGFG